MVQWVMVVKNKPRRGAAAAWAPPNGEAGGGEAGGGGGTRYGVDLTRVCSAAASAHASAKPAVA